MNENWYALIIASQFPVTVEQAFQILDRGKRIIGRKKKHVKLTVKDLMEMERLRNQGFTYRSIGEIFGMSMNATFRRLKAFRKKVKA
ncbi:hypothetical protein B5S50_14765 [Clostridium sp. 001]|nr:hypothetical protein B5S50_14765 [Clostridium sp. 001]